jgi:hypothetical protein
LSELIAKTRKVVSANHYKWLEAVKHLGCHTIRVNALALDRKEEVLQASVDGLSKLAIFTKDYQLNVIVENHGGHSSWWAMDRLT